MKKSLITLAVASGLMVSGTAFAADTTVYGIGQFEVGSYGGDWTGVQTTDNGEGRLGVQSKEDLGQGMAALIRLEYGLDTTGSNTALKARETWVGLKSAYGTLELGRIKSAYKYTGGVKYDPYTATLLESRGNGGMTNGAYGQNSFLSNSIGYGMAMGAVSFRLTYSPDNQAGVKSNPANGNGAKGKTIGFGFNGDNYGIVVAYADDGKTVNPTTGGAYKVGTNDHIKSTKIGGQFNMGGAGKISAQYESSKYEIGNPAGTGTDSTTIKTSYLDYQFNIDHNNGIDVALGSSKPDYSGAKTAKFGRIAFDHKLSRETNVWIGYRSTDSGVGPTATAFNPVVAVNSGKQTVIALGMRKKF